jgi:carbonic anhydrase
VVHLFIMIRFYALAMAVLSAVVAPASATGGNFSYDPEHPLGPDDWETLELEGNQCGGKYQSPIAIKSAACTEYADYKLRVRPSVLPLFNMQYNEWTETPVDTEKSISSLTPFACGCHQPHYIARMEIVHLAR